MSMGHTQKKRFIDKEFIKIHHMVVTSLVEHTLPLPRLETFRIYPPPPTPTSFHARDIIYGCSLA